MNLHAPSTLWLLRLAGLVTWLVVGVALLIGWPPEPRPGGEAFSTPALWLRGGLTALTYVGFGLSYWLLTRQLGQSVNGRREYMLLLLMTVCGGLVGIGSQTGLSAILFWISAGVLPWLLPLPLALTWLAAQALALLPILSQRGDWSWTRALLDVSLYFGASLVTFLTALTARRQTESRDELRRVNAELRATQVLLAESSRMAERMRISRELHDLVGHHLTALSINLEVAAHQVEGKPLEHVRQAQSVAKLLLQDVREVVSQLRHGDAVELSDAIRSLADGVPTPTIHIDLPERLALADTRRAQVLLRCVQEIITNTIKHARASNLWLKLSSDDQEIQLHARDDGRGADEVAAGNGLIGMSERLRQFGGRLEFATRPGAGFTLNATLPLASD